MEKASNLLLKFSQKLFSDPVEQEKFIDALIHPKPLQPCILWCKDKSAESPFQVELPVSWQPEFVDRLAIATKAGQHPLHQQGYYYCLDFSSVFAASTLLAIPNSVEVVIDMCASPGGKSIFAWKALSPKLLISNEVIGKRIGALLSNLKRCTFHQDVAENVTEKFILNVDSKILAQEIPKAADLVIVDAPCTGQSLIVKGEKNPGCFHPVNINRNANRQKRILANSAHLVSPQGYLAYMTCAYSPEENEEVITWLLNKFPQFQPMAVPHLTAYQSHLATFPCYRMLPQDRLGAGAFTVLLQNQEIGEKNLVSSEQLQNKFSPKSVNPDSHQRNEINFNSEWQQP